VCDSKWLTIGSYNINNISAYASIELNLDIRDTVFTKEMEQRMEKIIETECVPITKEQLSQSKNVLRQLLHWISYQLIRFMFYILTFYYKRRN
jgi:cardiolipin synthase